MLIPLTQAERELQEWALIELQGKVEPQRDIDIAESLIVGTMQLSKTNSDIIQLQIGYHVLEGKRLPLKKPLAIMEKQGHNGNAGSQANNGSPIICKVIGVLRHKYLFKTRPKALITKPGRHG
eukprot:GHRR01021352.1.p1 GENE.GHRR01021352.1~~GHRR01021352.1.p1  ORF type:complete len:123 (+),score=30.45 GHRR01021352.1:671-1039(+)